MVRQGRFDGCRGCYVSLLEGPEGSPSWVTALRRAGRLTAQRGERDAPAWEGEPGPQRRKRRECMGRSLRVHVPHTEPAVLRTPRGEVSLFTVIATLGAPLEVTADNLAIETFLPIDDESAARLAELDLRSRP